MQDGTKKSKRGRPRQFNETAILDAMTDVFLTYGYSGSSLELLSERTQLSRPSLYNAFGDKEAMYLTVLSRFGARMAADAGGQLFGASTLSDALKGFYSRAIEIYTEADNSGGCLVFTTAVTEVPETPAIAAALRSALKDIDETLTQSIRQHRQELTTKDCQAVASVASAGLMSLAIRARAGATRTELARHASATVEAVEAMTLG